jgi:hypothetical protein
VQGDLDALASLLLQSREHLVARLPANRLKPGRLDRERARVPGLVEFVEANEPRVIAFNEYVNEAGDEVSVSRGA